MDNKKLNNKEMDNIKDLFGNKINRFLKNMIKLNGLIKMLCQLK